MSFTAIPSDQIMQYAGHWMLAYGIAIARPLAIVTISPLFVRTQITGFMRGAVATAFAVPMLPYLGASLHESTIPTTMLLLLTFKEAVLGVGLGLMLGIPFWSLMVAGQILDFQRGDSAAQVNDPSGDEMSFSGVLLFVIGVLVFVSANGIQEVLGLLYRSWHIWPALSGLPSIGSHAPEFMLGMIDTVLAQAFRLVSPLVFAMLLVDLALIMVGRIAPQMRVDNQALAVRNLIFFVTLPIYAAYMMYYVRGQMFETPHVLDLISKVFTGPVGSPLP